MSKFMKTVAISAAILSASAMSANAFELYGFIKPNISQFGAPVELTMQHVDGKHRLKSATTVVPISYEAGVKGVQSYLVAIDVSVDHITKGDGAVFGLRRQLEDKDKVWGNASLDMTRAHLAPVEKVGKEVCASHEGPGEKRIDSFIPLKMRVAYYSTNAFAPGNGVASFEKSTVIPATIVCEAPVTRVPPKTPAKVSLLQMKLHTIPARPLCGKPVVVMAEFLVNYPGPLNFQYWRDNGDHQNATVTAASAVPAGQNLYMQRWSKTYTFTKTENRKYRIIAEGSPLSTGWVDVSVHCTGGITAPQANTGNAPKQGTFKPVIAPATTTKTATTGPARRFGIEREMKESGEKGGTEAPRASGRPPFFAQGLVLGVQR